MSRRPQRKLTQEELAELLGEERAEAIVKQDRACAKAYTDMETTTERIRSVRRAIRENAPTDMAWDDVTGEHTLSDDQLLEDGGGD